MYDLSSSALLSCFISGLKKEIQRDVIPWKLDSVTTAFTLAKLYEEKYFPTVKTGVGKNSFPPDIHAIVNNHKSTAIVGIPPKGLANTIPPVAGTTSIPRSSNASSSFKKMSFNEMQVRKAKGLCFNCDEKYTSTHRCQNKRMLLLQWEENNSVEDHGDNAHLVEIEPPPDGIDDTPKHSLNMMNSALVSGTLRFNGSINGCTITVLLDGAVMIVLYSPGLPSS